MSINNVWKYGFLMIVLLGLSNCEPNSTTINSVLNQNYADEIIASRKEVSLFMLLNSIPGSTVSVSHHGEIIWSEGFGYASTELEVPATRNTKYRIGELSQLFTSLAYTFLIEENILNPDSNVITYIPDFPEPFSKVTLNDLANHTSGIRAATIEEFNQSTSNITIKKGLDFFKTDSLLFEPGEYQNISMFNYNLLGAIIEETTDKQFYQVINEYIIDTLKLENTVADNPRLMIKNRADFYNKNLYALVENAMDVDASYRLPANGYLSTTDDIVTFCNAIFFSDDYITEKIKNILLTKTPISNEPELDYSHGWIQIPNDYGIPCYGAFGNIYGGSAALAVYPEQELVIASASNIGLGIEDLPLFKIAEIFLPEEVKQNEELTE